MTNTNVVKLCSFDRGRFHTYAHVHTHTNTRVSERTEEARKEKEMENENIVPVAHSAALPPSSPLVFPSLALSEMHVYVCVCVCVCVCTVSAEKALVASLQHSESLERREISE